MLHYQVTYFGKRINLDISHVLADGTGAMEFLNIIVLDYLKRKYPGKLDDINVHSGASEGDLNQDSYRQFFGSKKLSHGSNMGVQKPPETLGGFIENYSGFCSTNTLFSTMFGYGDKLTLGVSSAYTNTGVVKNFVRSFSESGVDITVCATEVIK